jgi:hypothetical protein
MGNAVQFVMAVITFLAVFSVLAPVLAAKYIYRERAWKNKSESR